MMIGSFSFDGVESSSFGLVCKSVKRPLLPQRKISRKDVVGVSGVFDSDISAYEMRTITIKVTYIGEDYYELRTRARSIASWLSAKGWRELQLHDEDDKYYLAKVTSEIDLESLWESGSANIVFDCQPFAYGNYKNLNFGVVEEGMFDFNYDGTYEINNTSPIGSRFKITISGEWTSLWLDMNNRYLEISKVSTGSSVIIDNVAMEVTMDGNNIFSDLSGDVDKFLQIEPGFNVLAVGGDDVDVQVYINYIEMWI